MEDHNTILTVGRSVLLEISGKTHKGVICPTKDSGTMSIKLLKIDPSLLHIMSNSRCKVTIIADDGNAHVLNTCLARKKIPVITIKIPENENIEIVCLRKYKRIPTSIWSAILVGDNAQGLKKVSDGTIVDLNVVGCCIMTHCDIRKGDIIWLSFYYGDEDVDPLLCKGEVRNSHKASYGATYYGISFKDISSKNEDLIKGIIEKPTA